MPFHAHDSCKSSITPLPPLLLLLVLPVERYDARKNLQSQ
jgi:hypothetical protein